MTVNILVRQISRPVQKSSLILRALVFQIFLGFFMIGITIYFSNIEKKSNQVLIANSFLEKKNQGITTTLMDCILHMKKMSSSENIPPFQSISHQQFRVM